MIERFTIPPDAKARLAMRERRESSHEANGRWPQPHSERTGDLPHPSAEREVEASASDLV